MKKNFLGGGEVVGRGGACTTREIRNSYKVLVGNLKGRRYVGVNGCIIFRNCLDQAPVVVKQRFPTFLTRGALFRINFYGGAP